MENFLYYNDLFDIYSDLLTDNERENFLEYYQEDLSLSEIAENKNISRSAVSKTINKVTMKLKDYESKLHIYEQNQKLLKVIELNDINKIKQEIKGMVR